MGNTASVMAIVAALVGIGSAWHISNLVGGAESAVSGLSAEATRAQTAAQRAADSASAILSQSDAMAGLVSDATEAAARVGAMAGTAEALSAAVTRAEEIVAEITAAKDTTTAAIADLDVALADLHSEQAAVAAISAQAQVELDKIIAEYADIQIVGEEITAALAEVHARANALLAAEPQNADLLTTITTALDTAGLDAAQTGAALDAIRQALGE